MYLARLINGNDPIVTWVDDEVGDVTRDHGVERIVMRPRRAWARKTKDGAAALSQTRAGAIASAKVVLEQQLLKQCGSNRKIAVKYLDRELE